MKLNLITLILVVVLLLIVGMHATSLPWTAYRVAGAAIVLPSLVLMAVARLELGRAFSVRPKASALVTTGLYSRIRNPIYVFGSLLVLGIIVWTGNPWLLLLFGILIPLQIYRSQKEAEVLEQKFGPAYLEYKKRTWF